MEKPFVVAQRSILARGRAASRDRYWLWVMALVLLGLALWFPYLAFPLDADAAGYATAAYWWAQGDTLYRDITITRPQGIFIIFRILLALHLDSAIGNHIVAAFYASACTIAFLALVQRIWGRRIAFAGATLFTLLLAAPFTEGYSTNAELFMLLPILGALHLLWSFSDGVLSRQVSSSWLVACGFLAALAAFIKPSAAPIMLVSIGWLFYRWRGQQLSYMALWQAEGAFVFGCALVVLPALLHGLRTAPDVYLGAVIFYRLGYDSAFTGSFVEQLSAFTFATLLLLAQLPILLAAGIGLWPTHARHSDPSHIFLLSWFFAAFAGVAMGGNWFPHYYLPLLAPLAVGIVLGWEHLLYRAKRRGPNRSRVFARTAGCIVLPILLGISIFNSVLAVLPGMLHYPATPSRSEVVAAYIRAHSEPTDTLYVTYQWVPVYQLSQRKPASRWLYYRELQRTPGAFSEQIVRLGDPQTAPLYIIAAQPFDAFGLDSAGALRAAVDQNYVLETTIEGISLYRRR